MNLPATGALEFFAALVADDDSLPLLEAAIAVAQDETPDLDIEAVLSDIDVLAARLRRRIPTDASPLQRLRQLNPYFFHELGFAGNVNDYHDPGNSLVPTVLHTRRGIPLTLALVYLELAAQAGLNAHGIAFPGHYLVKVVLPQGEVVMDPFSGQSLTREALQERLAPLLQAEDTLPELQRGAVTLAPFLQPAGARETLARLLRNLKECHRRNDDAARLAAVLRRLVLVLPQAWPERRELALVLARLGRHQEAEAEMATCLLQAGSAGDAAQWRQALARQRRAH